MKAFGIVVNIQNHYYLRALSTEYPKYEVSGLMCQGAVRASCFFRDGEAGVKWTTTADRAVTSLVRALFHHP